MKILPLVDKKIVQEFLEKAGKSAGAEFLASIEWAEVLKSEKERVETLGVYDKDQELIAILNLAQYPMYCYSPRGPVFSPDLPLSSEEQVWKALRNYIKKQGIVFWRVEPKSVPLIAYEKTRNLQPKETLLLDLTLDEKELVSSFHQKTRYNIRLAEKKGVSVREAKDIQDFDIFWSLMNETGERDAFKIHNKKHYQTLATANPRFIKLFLAEREGRVIAAGLFSFYGNKATYMHGASSNRDRQFMAPYLLQWSVIKLAKDAGYKYYDFYGIDEKKWPGVTRFKLGFSGYRASYAGTLDIILNRPKYLAYKLIRSIRRFL